LWLDWLDRQVRAQTIPRPAVRAAFSGQGLRGWRRGRALAGDRLVVVGPRDGVDHLLFGEILRALDLGDVTDEVAVLHDLGLEPGRAVGVPFGHAPVRQGHPYPELIGAHLCEVCIDAAVAQRVSDPAGPVLLHPPKDMCRRRPFVRGSRTPDRTRLSRARGGRG